MEIDRAIDITAEQRKTVLALLEKHLPNTAAWVYGSRAQWTARPQSDLDMVVFATPEQNSRVSDLREAFEESNLPFRVDLFIWDEVPEQFREQIEAEHVVLVEKEERVVGGGWRETIYGLLSADFFENSLANLCHHDNGVQTGPFGSQLHQKDYVPVGTPILTVEHLGENRIIHQDLPHVSDYDRERLSKYTLRKGDIVFSRVGSVDRRALVHEAEDGWLFSGRCLRVRPDPNKIDPGYLSYFFGWASFQEHIRSIAVGATMPSLNTQILSDVVVPYPPLPEQRAIAHILGTLDDKIELNRRMNETLEEMARALFKSWFVDFLPVRAKQRARTPACVRRTGRQTGDPVRAKAALITPPPGGSDWTVERARAYLPAARGLAQAGLDGMDASIADLFPDRLVDSELGPIPEGWEVVPLPEMIEINPPRSLRKGKIAPYLDMANMPTIGHVPNTVIDRPFGSGMRFTNGDTLIARITPCLENGKTAYVDFLQPGKIGWGSTEYIVMRPKPPLPNEFAYCLARSAGFREFAIQNMTGTSGRQRVPAKALSQFLFPSPPEQIAASFGKVAQPLFARASEAVRESRTLAALRDTLLPKLVSGALRVTDDRLKEYERQIP